MMKDENQTIWHGKTFDFNVEKTILPNGRETVTEMIRHPGSSAVVPIHKSDSVILIHQYRPVLKHFVWEIPAGSMLQGEEPLACAGRELREECGFLSEKFEKIGEILVAPGYSDERIHLFIATELIPCKQDLDEDELLTTHIIPFDQAIEMIDKGEIQDAMTIIGLKISYPIWKKRDQLK
jgi:ADP-ribose pyrophosphatase